MASFGSSARSVLRFVAAVARDLDSPPGIFIIGWLFVVGGVALQSRSWALVTGGALLIGVVVGGVMTGGTKKA